MKKTYFLGIYWGARADTVENCTNKVIATFDSLAHIDASFRSWYKTSRPRKGDEVMPLDTVTREGVLNLLLNGQIVNDIGQIMNDMGFMTYVKSREDFSKSHVLSIICGGSFDKIPNSVTLNISKCEEVVHLASKDRLEAIFAEFIRIWQPETGVIRENNSDIFTYHCT